MEGEAKVWESGFSISVGCMVMYLSWAAAVGLLVGGLLFSSPEFQNIGLGLSALAASLTVMRDNQRTRRMLRRPDENLRPMR